MAAREHAHEHAMSALRRRDRLLRFLDFSLGFLFGVLVLSAAILTGHAR